jgi:hypothetical protein
MFTLLVAAVLGQQCGVSYYRQSFSVPSYGYNQGVQVSYGTVGSYQPQVAQQPYYAPAAVDLVGKYLREEFAAQTAAQAKVDQEARLARIEALLVSKQTPPPAPPPQPIFQAPYPPAKSPPLSFPSPQSPAPQSPPLPGKFTPEGTVPPPPVPGPQGQFVPTSAGNIDEAVTLVMRNSCSACHAAPATKGGGVVLLDSAGNQAPMSPFLKLLVRQDVESGRMPKGGPELSSEQVAKFDDWIAAHSEEINLALQSALGNGR